MYIEQGNKGNIGLWKYLIIPGLFMLLMLFNYAAIVFMESQGISVDALIQNQIKESGKTSFFIQSLVPLAIGLGVVLFWTKYVHNQSLVSLTTSRKKIDWNRIFFSFIVWGVISVGAVFVDKYFAPESYQWNFDGGKFAVLAVVAVLLVPLQTSFEEYLFRGHMMQGLGLAAGNRWVPLFVTSILFGIMHMGNPEVEKMGMIVMVFYIGTGFLLGIMTLMDEGLELAIGFHAANNLFTALLVTSTWTAFQTDSIYINTAEPSDSALATVLPIFIIYPIILFIFAKRYKWKDWGNRLFGKVDKQAFKKLPSQD